MKTRKISITVAMLFLFACSTYPSFQQRHLATSVTTEENDQCITPPFNFAFPIDKGTDNIATHIPPSSPWHEESELPIVNEGSVSDYFELVRTTDESAEIWLRRFITQKDTFEPTYQILVYDINTKQWKILLNQDNDGREIVSNIFESKDGKIWGISHRKLGLVTRTLMLFNESLKQFEPVLNDVNALIPSFAPSIDSDGRFWYIVYNSLHSFDPITNKVVDYDLSISDLPLGLSDSIAFTPDGGIYLMARAKAELFHYNPQTGKLSTEFVPIIAKDIVSPGSLAGSDNIVNLEGFFMDRSGRLWIHDYGWKEPDGDWYRIVRSPVFIHEDTEANLGYFWDRPTAIFEDSYNHLWFSASNGLTSLDIQTGAWCHVTTANSKIGEDQQGNLWIVAYNKLYKYSLKGR